MGGYIEVKCISCKKKCLYPHGAHQHVDRQIFLCCHCKGCYTANGCSDFLKQFRFTSATTTESI